MPKTICPMIELTPIRWQPRSDTSSSRPRPQPFHMLSDLHIQAQKGHSRDDLWLHLEWRHILGENAYGAHAYRGGEA